MKEHYTKSTVAAQAFCKRCNRQTMHRVDSGRKGPCLVCMKLLEEEHQKVRPVKSMLKQLELFK